MGGPGPRSSDRVFRACEKKRHRFAEWFSHAGKTVSPGHRSACCVPLHSNEARTHRYTSKLEYRSFAYDRRSTDARAVEVPRTFWGQKISQNFRKSAYYSQIEAARSPSSCAGGRSRPRRRVRPRLEQRACPCGGGDGRLPPRPPSQPAQTPTSAAPASSSPLIDRQFEVSALSGGSVGRLCGSGGRVWSGDRSPSLVCVFSGRLCVLGLGILL